MTLGGSTTGNININPQNGAGTVTVDGGLVLSSTSGEGISGAGLSDCDDYNQKLGWNSATNQFTCITNYPDTATFTDTTTEDIADSADDLWDGTYANITPNSTSTTVLVSVSAKVANTTDSQFYSAFKIFRAIGSNPTCTDTQVGGELGLYGDNTLEGGNISGTFIDSPASTSNVRYTLCSDTASESIAANTVSTPDIRFSLVALGADVAENYYTRDETLGPADVVVLDPSLPAGVKKSTKPHDPQILGVVSTQPRIVLDDAVGLAYGRPVAIGLAGRVPVKVTNESGPIEVGDELTSASVPGHAMQATKTTRTLGKALSPFKPDELSLSNCPVGTAGNIKCGMILVFVENSYFTPDVYFSSTGDLQISKESSKENLEQPGSFVYDSLIDELGNPSLFDNLTYLIKNQSSSFQLFTSTAQVIDNLGAFADLAAGKIKTGYLETEYQVVKNTLLAKNIFTESYSSLLTTTYQLLATNISVREKITSPVIETGDLVATGTAKLAKVETNVVKPKDGDLILDLSSSNQASTSEVKNDDKGPMAKLIIRGLEGKSVAIIDPAGNASFSGQLAGNSLLINSDATISGQLTAENIRGNELDISGNLSASQASLSGKLIAKEVEAENINTLEQNIASLSHGFTDLNDNNNGTMEQLSNDVNEIQKLLAEIKNQPLSDPQYYQNLDNNQPITDYRQPITDLTVTGSSNLYNLSVTGSGTIGDLLIENNSILSLAWDLKLSALSTIKLFEDAVVISKDGTITTKGTLIAQAGIKTNKIEPLNEAELVTINRLAVNNLTITDKYLQSTPASGVIAASDNFNQNGISTPAIETKSTSAGNGSLPENSQEVIIYNDNVIADSLIYLTPTSPTPSSTILTVVKKESCNSIINTSEVNDDNKNTSEVNDLSCRPHFKVAVDKPESFPILFNWLIIN